MQNPIRKFLARHPGLNTRRLFLSIVLIAIALPTGTSGPNALAIDYVLTIGGGYEPAGNQASLEANVLFFQQLVDQQFPSTTRHQVFFADGLDAKEDLQVMSPKSESTTPTIALLESESFSMLISYLCMPKMDGLQVLSIVRRKFPQLRIVVMTAVEPLGVMVRLISVPSSSVSATSAFFFSTLLLFNNKSCCLQVIFITYKFALSVYKFGLIYYKFKLNII